MEASSLKTYFGPVDIVVFAVALVVAVFVGVYYAYKDRNKNTLTNYYYGGKKISPIPLGLSMAVTFISAITVMSFPADAYTYGMVVVWYGCTTIIPTTIACLYYIPFMHRLQVKTIYEFFELRFHIVLRRLASGIEICNQSLYMGFTIYLPSLALNAVTPLNLTWTIALTGGICTFYTVIGGMKAVVWTDTLQSVIMFAGALAALVKGTEVVGGLNGVWDALDRGGRLNMFDFNPDPTLKNTFWTIMIGFSCSQITLVCVNQSIYQRYVSCSSVKNARIAAVLAVVFKIVIATFCVLGGCVAYAYFEGCDPLTTGAIKKSDQIMPYFVMKLFHDIPGFAGFYVAAAYSGTLSTVSSGINSAAAMLLHDFIQPVYPEIRQSTKMYISKIAVGVFGITVTGIAYLASLMGGTVVKMVIIIRSSCGVPIVGMMTMAILFPWTNSKGAATGLLTGAILSFWLSFGSYAYGTSPQSIRKLPTSVEDCPVREVGYGNFTAQPDLSSVAAVSTEAEKLYPAVYALSYFYISVLSLATTISVGLLVSFLTGPNKPRDLNPTYFVPIIDNKRLPEKIRKFFRFGVLEIDEFAKELETISNEEDGAKSPLRKVTDVQS